MRKRTRTPAPHQLASLIIRKGRTRIINPHTFIMMTLQEIRITQDEFLYKNRDQKEGTNIPNHNFRFLSLLCFHSLYDGQKRCYWRPQLFLIWSPLILKILIRQILHSENNYFFRNHTFRYKWDCLYTLHSWHNLKVLSTVSDVSEWQDRVEWQPLFRSVANVWFIIITDLKIILHHIEGRYLATCVILIYVY